MQPWRRISGCHVYLVGDAAAQVKVTTVGGLVTGLRGAKAAASAILGRRDYAKELGSLRRELSLHLLIRTALNRFQGADYDRLLGLLNQDAIHLLGRYNRDRAASVLCRIILAQPSTSELRCTVDRPILATFIERESPYPWNSQYAVIIGLIFALLLTYKNLSFNCVL